MGATSKSKITTTHIIDGITLALCPSIMCVVVIFDLLVATSGINPRVPGFESHFTGSPILTVKARMFDFSDSFKLFHDDIDNKSESQGCFCFVFLTSSQLFR